MAKKEGSQSLHVISRKKKSKVVSLKLPRGKSQELWCSKKAHVQQALGVLCYGLSLALN